MNKIKRFGAIRSDGTTHLAASEMALTVSC